MIGSLSTVIYSCSKDNEPSFNISDSQRLYQINSSYPEIYYFEYDSQNRLISLIGKDDDYIIPYSESIYISYSPLTLTFIEKDTPGIFTTVYSNLKTNPDGFISYAKVYENDQYAHGTNISYNYEIKLTYNSGYLTKVTFVYGDEENDDYEFYNLSWENGLLKSIKDEDNDFIERISYDNAPDNSHKQWVPYWLEETGLILMSNLFGNPPQKLMTKEISYYNSSYTYVLDNEGYISSVNINDDYGSIVMDYFYNSTRGFSPSLSEYIDRQKRAHRNIFKSKRSLKKYN